MNISEQVFYVQENEMILFTDLKEGLYGNLGSLALDKDILVVSIYSKPIIFDITTKTKKVVEIPSSQNYGANKLSYKGIIYSSDDYIKQFKDHDFVEKIKISSNSYIENDKPSPLIIENQQDQLFTFHQRPYKDCKVNYYWSKQWTALEVPKIIIKSKWNKIHYLDHKIWITTGEGVFILEHVDNQLLLKEQYLNNYYITDLLQYIG